MKQLINWILVLLRLRPKKVGQLKPKRGHKVFEFNYETKEFKEAKYDYELNTGKKSIIKNKNCTYVSALNKQNAAKKLLKRL